MSNFDTSLQTIDPSQLTTVAGGFDFGQMVKAGNDAAPAGQKAGEYLGPAIGAGIGAAAASETGPGMVAGAVAGAGAGANAYHQITGR